MLWKHFCVEQFIKEGDKDPIIEAMNQHNKNSSNFWPDYFAGCSEEEKAFF